MILDAGGRLLSETDEQETCNHGVTFDAEEAAKMLADWQPADPASFIMETRAPLMSESDGLG